MNCGPFCSRLVPRARGGAERANPTPFQNSPQNGYDREVYKREALSFYLRVWPRLDEASQKAFSSLGPASVCVDVGANVGGISKAMRSRGAFVHAIEPNPWALEKLSIASAKDSKLQAYGFAASLRNEHQQLYLHSQHRENPSRFSTGSSLLSAKPNLSSASVEVQGRDLAEFLSELGPVDFLKIDVEGFEVELVPHLVHSNALAEVSFVAVETHDKEKWRALSPATKSMRAAVEVAGLSNKFSWNWP